MRAPGCCHQGKEVGAVDAVVQLHVLERYNHSCFVRQACVP